MAHSTRIVVTLGWVFGTALKDAETPGKGNNPTLLAGMQSSVLLCAEEAKH